MTEQTAITASDLYRTINQRPFLPFEIYLTDYSKVVVSNRDAIAYRKGGSKLVILNDDDSAKWILIEHVVQVMTQVAD
ncbi:hypothetical protein ACYOEI_08715 [Singulisphaera rosea]